MTVLPGILSKAKVEAWRRAFGPVLRQAIDRWGTMGNRGPCRYYTTLPFEPPWADPEVIDHDDIIGVVSELVGEDGAMCQLAADTPVQGSTRQELHRDAGALFPEMDQPTPPYLLAVNFPLVDVTQENGPLEVAPGSHALSDAEVARRLDTGELALTPILMEAGDVMIRDVRHVHRGTPNRAAAPRPMVVLGFQRPWLRRPDVDIVISREVLETLPARARHWLRINPVVEERPEEMVERTILPPGLRA